MQSRSGSINGAGDWTFDVFDLRDSRTGKDNQRKRHHTRDTGAYQLIWTRNLIMHPPLALPCRRWLVSSCRPAHRPVPLPVLAPPPHPRPSFRLYRSITALGWTFASCPADCVARQLKKPPRIHCMHVAALLKVGMWSMYPTSFILPQIPLRRRSWWKHLSPLEESAYAARKWFIAATFALGCPVHRSRTSGFETEIIWLDSWWSVFTGIPLLVKWNKWSGWFPLVFSFLFGSIELHMLQKEDYLQIVKTWILFNYSSCVIKARQGRTAASPAKLYNDFFGLCNIKKDLLCL